MKNSLKSIIAGLFAFLILLLSPLAVQAETNYGDGSYGTGDYNVGEVSTPTPTPTSNSSSSSSNSSSSSAPSCDKTTPGSAPLLWGATTKGVDSILLQFGAASDPVEHYALEFGVEPGKYIWGATTIGNKDIREYEVKSLSPNTKYYFRIRAGNGCAAGEWSNEISARTKGYVTFNQLDFSDTEVTPIKEETGKEDVCQNYTVKSGDTLWKIAQSELGDGNKYKEIIEQNKDEYPTLVSSNSISSGWELKLNCTGQKSDQDKTETKQAGYDVNVLVADKNSKPVKGAKVTLHSDPKEAVTGDDGIARFKDVEGGEHKVIVAYNNYEGEQSIFLKGDDTTKVFNVNVTIEPNNVLLSKQVMVVVGVMTAVIAILTLLLVKAKRNH